MSAAVSYERVRDLLATLGLEATLTSLDPVLARGQQDQEVSVEVLGELLGLELSSRYALPAGSSCSHRQLRALGSPRRCSVLPLVRGA